MVSREEWGARKPGERLRKHAIARITLHHEGVVFDGSTPAPAYLRKVQRWSMDDRKWPDIPYHFLIDHRGTIYVGRPITAPGDTNTQYDPTGHALIAVLGDYDRQKPNAGQLKAVCDVMAWIAAEYSIPPSEIAGHRDFIPANAAG